MTIRTLIASGDDGLGALGDAPDPPPAAGEAVVAVESFSPNRDENFLLGGGRPDGHGKARVAAGALRPEIGVEAEWAHAPEILADPRDRRVRGNVLTIGGGGA